MTFLSLSSFHVTELLASLDMIRRPTNSKPVRFLAPRFGDFRQVPSDRADLELADTSAT